MVYFINQEKCLPLWGRKVIGITCGQTSSMAVLENGGVWVGYNGNGQLGWGTTSTSSTPESDSTAGCGSDKCGLWLCFFTSSLDEGALYAGANSYRASWAQALQGPNTLHPPRWGGSWQDWRCLPHITITSQPSQDSRCYMWDSAGTVSCFQQKLLSFPFMMSLPALPHPAWHSCPRRPRWPQAQCVDSLKLALMTLILQMSGSMLRTRRSMHTRQSLRLVSTSDCMFQETIGRRELPSEGCIDIRHFSYPCKSIPPLPVHRPGGPAPRGRNGGCLTWPIVTVSSSLRGDARGSSGRGSRWTMWPCCLYATAIKYQAQELEDFVQV